MAKIAYGAMVDNARGKLGGIVFTRTRSGNNTRVRVRPRNPRSAQQTAVRTALTASSRAFKALSATDLALWAAYAGGITKHQSVSGQAYHPSAITAFNKLATKFLQVAPAGTIPSTPPTSPAVFDDITVAVAGGSGIVTFTASADASSGFTLEVLLQPLPSANRTPRANGYRTEGFSTAAHTTPLVISHLQADYLHPTSPVPAGTYVPAFQQVKLATGEASTLTVLPAIVVT